MNARFVAPLAAFLFVLSVAPVPAQELTWNGPANGTWDTATANWSGATTTWVNDGARSALFNGTGTGTVALSLATTSLTGLTVSANGYTFGPSNGFSFTGATPAISVSPGVTATLTNSSGVTTTAANLSVSGGGTLDFDPNANNYLNLSVAGRNTLVVGDNTTVRARNTANLSGNPFQSSSRLDLGTSGTFVAGGGGGRGVNVTLAALEGSAGSSYLIGATGANNSTLTITAPAATTSTFGGAIGYVGGSLPVGQENRFTLTANGGGTVVLSGSNSFSGGVSVGGNTVLRLGSSSALGAGTASAGVTINDGSSLDVNGQAIAAPYLFLAVTGAGVGSTGALQNSSGTAASLTIPVRLNGGSGNSVGGSGNLTLSGQITNSGRFDKDGAGTVTLSSSLNNWTGGTRINAGTLRMGVANVLPGSGTFQLNGGTLSTGATTGFGDATVGPLNVSAVSTIALGTGDHTLTFSGLTATGTLNVTGWSGSAHTSGTAGKLVFSGLTDPNTTYAAWLTSVAFTGYDTGGTFVANGANHELVPVPEPSLALLAAGLLAAVAARRRA